jgi:4-hydroxy-tetrahydrodipicolinate synthase
MEKVYQKFKGSMPIMVTPTTREGEIDLNSLRRLVEYCIKNDVAAIGAFGGLSEFEKISDYDREAILDAIVGQTAGRLPVFVGITSNSMKSTLHNIKQAEKMGGDLLMVCSPEIGGAMKQKPLYDFYKAVSGSTDMTIILQDTGNSSGTYNPEFIARLYHETGNIRYGKVEGKPTFLQEMEELSKLVDDGFQIIGGGGGRNMIRMLNMGVTAIMAGTYFIEIYNHAIMTYLKGDVEKAENFYNNTVLPYVQLQSFSKKRTMKYVLKLRGIIDCEEILFPYDESPLPQSYIKEIERTILKIEKDMKIYW